jgi:hypothetical protein
MVGWRRLTVAPMTTADHREVATAFVEERASLHRRLA